MSAIKRHLENIMEAFDYCEDEVIVDLQEAIEVVMLRTGCSRDEAMLVYHEYWLPTNMGE